MPTYDISEANAMFTSLGEAVVALTNLVQIDVAEQVDAAVIDTSPVDTGLVRSNWLLSTGSPIGVVIEPYHPYPKHSKALGQAYLETDNADAAKLQGRSALVGHSGTEDIFISNNVDYVDGLNNGTTRPAISQMRPGFVERGIDIGLDKGVDEALADFDALF